MCAAATTTDAVTDATPNTATDATTDATPNTSSDATPDAAADATTNAPPDVPLRQLDWQLHPRPGWHADRSAVRGRLQVHRAA